MTTKHPLVGKKLVDKNPQRGEVTRQQIHDTLDKVVIEQFGSWLVSTTDYRWIVHVDAGNNIIDVIRT